jgi:hypothetical protein
MGTLLALVRHNHPIPRLKCETTTSPSLSSRVIYFRSQGIPQCYPCWPGPESKPLSYKTKEYTILERASPRETSPGWPLYMLTDELRQMGSQTVNMNGNLPWLIRWTYLVDTRDFCSVLAAVVGPVKISFSHNTLFQFICPYRSASCAGSRAG